MNRIKVARVHGCDSPERLVELAKGERDDDAALRRLGDMAMKCAENRNAFQAPMKEIIDGRARSLAEQPDRPLAAVRIDVDLPMRLSVFWASVSVDGRLAPVRPSTSGRQVVVAEVDVIDSADHRRVVELRRRVELDFPARRVDIVVRIAASDAGDPTLHLELAPPQARDATAPRARFIVSNFGRAPLELGMAGMFFEGTGHLCLGKRARPETLLLTIPVHPRIVGYMIDSARTWTYVAPSNPDDRPCTVVKVGTSAR
jgi:hypothetical protein